ncbi:hypothetical protein A9Q74_14180 [Colwellia sp. 39_35_sub15_T18]|nr:hypothetical protein A9Q74_14180 [Colwellia sp. 39_35_sub15_T18]
MRIGIDFDNTMVDYTGVFYQVALELGWIPKETLPTKFAVKQSFLDANNERKWTELQGIVYGREIHQAIPFAGIHQTITTWLNKGHELFIISHKTKYPIIGDKVNFHIAAMTWLEQYQLVSSLGSLSTIAKENVFFNETKEEKIAKIAALSCDIFIDDLPSILMHKSFPKQSKKVLFDPKNEQKLEQQYSELAKNKISHWSTLAEHY